MKRMLFVCTGNTCRSAMAEMYLNHMVKTKKINITADSAGVMAAKNSKMSEFAQQVLKEKKIKIDNYFRSKQISLKHVNENDIILCMEISHKMYVLQHYPSAQNKVYTLNEYAKTGNDNISDPMGFDIKSYKKTFNKIKKAIDNIIKKENSK